MRSDGSVRRTVAFMNQKGGVGKTTSAVNLAAAWANQGVRTLVVDLDPQGHATLALGVEVAPGDGAEAVLLGGEASAIARSGGLDVLGADTDLAAAEHELAHAEGRHHRLRDWLVAAGDRYDVVVIDCPPSLGLLTLNGLAAADEVIIPMHAHFLALQGVGKLLETVTAVAGRVNPGLIVRGVMFCAHEEQSRHSREVVNDLVSFFEASRETDSVWAGAEVLRPAIRRNIKLAECPSFGQTVFEYDATCAGAADYSALAAALLTRWLEADQPPAAERDAGAELEAKPEATVRAES